ncbi:ribosome biogenesis GTPase Der [Ancylobacter sp. Lp-2]|uniref:ribosome biogenesis GTPase Der n=1 Tax=Ancylobacter sp. Lp-2 TaxID=2881339 RepID=UPI001E3CDEAD|nr:ribosome biogenesis GTPase Der [Ancylobacter sp. Lp-2]MCB4769277.1 ribosome biogenesis GTPase Der [Ancylobacter sp. Lp-2]
MTMTVAIVGRPNVGKSTLFNRLVGKRLALVDDRPGVTRDRREGDARLGHLEFRVIDTAGLEEAKAESLEGRMRAQTEAAIDDADVLLFLIDARAGLTPTDRAFAELARRSGKHTILVANKSEGRDAVAGALDAYSLGLGDPVELSAEHGEGMGELVRALMPCFPDDADEEEEPEAEEGNRRIRVAVLGRPNAGKSTLINALLGEDRLLTGPEAGITRDSIAVDVERAGVRLKLFDTAGMRKRARVEDKLEKLSVADGLRAARFAEVVVVMMDATHPFEEQDLRIADLVVREGRALVLAISKSDLVKDQAGIAKKMREEADHWLPQARGMPAVMVSGLTGEGLDRLVRAISEAHEVWNRRVATNPLNRWLIETTTDHPPPAVSGRRIKLRYITQPKSRPPSFVLFCSRADALPESYIRYLVNGLRATFDLPGVPIRLTLREKDNPYADKD